MALCGHWSVDGSGAIRVLVGRPPVATVGGMAVELVGRVRSVCVGDVGALAVGSRTEESAFVKTPVDGPVRLSVLGLAGDAGP